MPPLEGDGEEVKEEKGLNILTPKKAINQISSIISKNKNWK